MPRITIQAVTAYLETLYSKPVRVLSMTTEGKQEAGDDLKAFGYGLPLFLEYEVAGERKKSVLETMTPSSYGHDHFSDRAQAILWSTQHSTVSRATCAHSTAAPFWIQELSSPQARPGNFFC